jgi:8-oxo-dGTP pyrophosphatase MutT (NUDIX family)
MIEKYKKIIACGGLVECQNKILLIYKRNYWDLPKGKIKKDQTKESCALSEVAEETGLNINVLHITGKLPPTHHISDYKGSAVYKKVYWFSMKYDGNLDDITPEIKENIYGVVWFDKDQVLNLHPMHQRIHYLLEFSTQQLASLLP